MSIKGETEGTKLFERVAALEALVDGGPGNTPACKRHEADLKEVKNDVAALKGLMQRYGGALVIVTFLIQVILPIAITHFITKKP